MTSRSSIGTRRRSLAIAIPIAALALVAPFALSPYRVSQLTLALAYAVAVLGLNLVSGYGRQLSLGHSAFFALGAYVAAILVERAGAPWPVTLPAAAMAGLVAGLLFGLPALRLSGLHLGVVTLSVAIAAPPVLKRLDGLTGGASGMSVDTPSVPGWMPLAQDQFVYLVALAVAGSMFLAGRNLMRGPLGAAIVAVGDDEAAVQATGLGTGAVKTRLFAWSGMYAAVAGALYALSVGFVAPESFTLFLSLTFFVAMVVGGAASIAGAVFGALFIEFVPVYAGDVDPALTGVIYGSALIAVLHLAPGGIAGAASHVASSIGKR